MGRDGFVTPRLGMSSQRTGAPAVALATVITIAAAGLIGMRAYGISDAVSAFFYPGTIGVLSMIVAYAVTNIGAGRMFLRDSRERLWELFFPAAAIIVLVYVFYRNAVGQLYPFNWFPWVVAAWLLAGFAIIMAVPGLASRIGANLTESEGMQAVSRSPGG
jgi:amino acid transporter